jgi:hypothetical protein
MHSTIEHKPMPANLKIVRIRTDLRAPCEVNEFHCELKVEGLRRSTQKQIKGGSASLKTMSIAEGAR